MTPVPSPSLGNLQSRTRQMEEQRAYLQEDNPVQARESPDALLSWLLIGGNSDRPENEGFYQPSLTAHVDFKNPLMGDLSGAYHAGESALQTTNDDLFLECLEDDWTRWLEEENIVLPSFTADDHQDVVPKSSADAALASLSSDLNEYHSAGKFNLVTLGQG
jgi:hypothetical protein